MESNENASTEEFESRQKELEGIAQPIIMKLYQDGGAGGMPGGMPGGMGGMPDMGDFGGAAGGGGGGARGGASSGGSSGPKVEEVD